MPDQAALTSMSASTTAAPLVQPTLARATSNAGLAVTRGLGSRLFDSAGHSYIDLCMGHGALLLGHGATVVKEALHQQLENGWLFGASHPAIDRLTTLIQDAGLANESVALCDSASDATLLAMRAARAFTGREKIAVFSGATHGLHDAALITAHFEQAAASANDATLQHKAHIGAGIPASIDDTITVLPFAREHALHLIAQHRDHLAAVIVEPLLLAHPASALAPWLRQLEATCRTNNVLLILDETYSGFRLGYGGAQRFFGLKPDLVTYGNALGGGVPIGAVAGRKDVMSVFGGGTPQQRIFCGSTTAGNPFSAAAAEATLGVLSLHRDTIYPQLNAATTQIAADFKTAARAFGIAAHLATAGSMFRISLSRDSDGDSRTQHSIEAKRESERVFYARVFEKRVFIHASKCCFLSTAHTIADIAEISAALTEGLKAIRR